MVMSQGEQKAIYVIRGGGGGGRWVQAYNFGNFDFEIWVEGEGQDTSRLF